MKVFLDDRRPAPDGWVLVRWPEEVVALLKTGKVIEISLDHDLADPLVHGCDSSYKERTGYDVLLWIEEQVATTDFVPPIIYVHTDNSSARKKMMSAIESIEKLRLISRV